MLHINTAWAASTVFHAVFLGTPTSSAICCTKPTSSLPMSPAKSGSVAEACILLLLMHYNHESTPRRARLVAGPRREAGMSVTYQPTIQHLPPEPSKQQHQLDPTGRVRLPQLPASRVCFYRTCLIAIAPVAACCWHLLLLLLLLLYLLLVNLIVCSLRMVVLGLLGGDLRCLNTKRHRISHGTIEMPSSAHAYVRS